MLGGGGKKRLNTALGRDGKRCLEVDISGEPDIKANLETDLPLKIGNNSFETVVCLEVLEHVENPGDVLEECLRISSRYVILSLPNPMREIVNYIFAKKKVVSDPERKLRVGVFSKFYGLPPLHPLDRHKWFYTYADAERFVSYHAEKSRWSVSEYFAIGGVQSNPFLKVFTLLIPEHIRKLLFPVSFWFILERKS